MNDTKIDAAVEIIGKSLHDWWYLTDNDELRFIWRKDIKDALLKALPILIESPREDDFLSRQRKIHQYVMDREARENGTENE